MSNEEKDGLKSKEEERRNEMHASRRGARKFDLDFIGDSLLLLLLMFIVIYIISFIVIYIISFIVIYIISFIVIYIISFIVIYIIIVIENININIILFYILS